MNRREMMLMTSAAAGAVALAALPTTTAARGPVRLQDVGRLEAIIINGNRYEPGKVWPSPSEEERRLKYEPVFRRYEGHLDKRVRLDHLLMEETS